VIGRHCSVWIIVWSACAAGLGGCATQSMHMRSLPPETPAADNAAAAENAAELAKALASEPASTGAKEGEAVPLMTSADAPSLATYDPWGRFNRFTYRFNTRFDEALFLPIANGYRRLPLPLRSGVHNFFGNLGEVDNIINYTLQLRLVRGLRSAGRLLINTTFGLGGLFDVAKKFKLTGAPTGLSATLATWGVHPGPYLVIPLLGPSTLRDGIGVVGDFGASHVVDIAHLYRGDLSWYLEGVNLVDQRANVDFRYYSSGSPFEYETIRFLYVRKRLIEDAGLYWGRQPQKTPPGVPAGE
jgi:phospholipid-binding lipoprotein MlaA